MLDFNRPLRFEGKIWDHIKLQVMVTARNRDSVCVSDGKELYIVTEHGIVKGHPLLKVINISEGPKDYILLVRFNTGEWAVYGGVDGNEKFTKTEAFDRIEQFPDIYKAVHVGE